MRRALSPEPRMRAAALRESSPIRKRGGVELTRIRAEAYIRQGNLEELAVLSRQLLASNHSPQVRQAGDHLFLTAAEIGDADCVKTLLNCGWRPRRGSELLHVACLAALTHTRGPAEVCAALVRACPELLSELLTTKAGKTQTLDAYLEGLKLESGLPPSEAAKLRVPLRRANQSRPRGSHTAMLDGLQRLPRRALVAAALLMSIVVLWLWILADPAVPQYGGNRITVTKAMPRADDQAALRHQETTDAVNRRAVQQAIAEAARQKQKAEKEQAVRARQERARAQHAAVEEGKQSRVATTDAAAKIRETGRASAAALTQLKQWIKMLGMRKEMEELVRQQNFLAAAQEEVKKQEKLAKQASDVAANAKFLQEQHLKTMEAADRRAAVTNKEADYKAAAAAQILEKKASEEAGSARARAEAAKDAARTASLEKASREGTLQRYEALLRRQILVHAAAEVLMLHNSIVRLRSNAARARRNLAYADAATHAKELHAAEMRKRDLLQSFGFKADPSEIYYTEAARQLGLPAAPDEISTLEPGLADEEAAEAHARLLEAVLASVTDSKGGATQPARNQDRWATILGLEDNLKSLRAARKRHQELTGLAKAAAKKEAELTATGDRAATEMVQAEKAMNEASVRNDLKAAAQYKLAFKKAKAIAGASKENRMQAASSAQQAQSDLDAHAATLSTAEAAYLKEELQGAHTRAMLLRGDVSAKREAVEASKAAEDFDNAQELAKLASAAELELKELCAAFHFFETAGDAELRTLASLPVH